VSLNLQRVGPCWKFAAIDRHRGEIATHQFAWRRASTIAMRRARNAGITPARIVATNPTAAASAVTHGISSMLAVNPMLEFGDGGIGIPTAEIRMANSTPITTPRTEPIAPSSRHSIITGTPARAIIEKHGYTGHVKGRGQEAQEKRRHPTKRARRWIVEVAHSWFNRFRKLLVRYEKLECSFLGLNHLAAAIIVFRKIPLAINLRIIS